MFSPEEARVLSAPVAQRENTRFDLSLGFPQIFPVEEFGMAKKGAPVVSGAPGK